MQFIVITVTIVLVVVILTYPRRLRILETNLGRNAGWLIEWRGQVVAALDDCQYEDMFWDSYQLEILATDISIRKQLLQPEFWVSPEQVEIVWRNRVFGQVADGAFSAGLNQKGRLVMRKLYLTVCCEGPWDEFILWARRRLRDHS